jgi:predicted DNA-binding transcriptional regulator YafY
MKTLATASLARPVQIQRFLAIHEELLKKARRPSGPPVNCTTLAEILERTRRTIERDIECLKSDPYNLPIEFDRESNSYRYTEDVPFFPLGANLTREELLAMTVARQALGVFSGADFGENLREAFDKVTGGALNDLSLGEGTPFDDLISYRTPGASVAAPAVFASILNCLLERRVLEVDYQAKAATAPKRRTLHPYHLACIENRWILIAREVGKAEADAPIRTYVVARLAKPKWGEAQFKRPANFDASRYVSSAFGAHSGEGKHLVRVRIAKIGAHHVLERRWHPTQVIKQEPGGSVVMEFTLSDLGDITRWILGFGADCEVLAPPALRDLLAGEAQRMVELYGPAKTTT